MKRKELSNKSVLGVSGRMDILRMLEDKIREGLIALWRHI